VRRYLEVRYLLHERPEDPIQDRLDPCVDTTLGRALRLVPLSGLQGTA
jgi:hypothetical protein